MDSRIHGWFCAADVLQRIFAFLLSLVLLEGGVILVK
jgi:hypothetical protein